MCGIAGFINLQGNNPIDSATLRRMIRQIEHRGPDSINTKKFEQIGLAHARLSIIDLTTGDQPICNEDKSIWVVFNGEIFNYIELREQLVKKGHRFSTKSDTEVIVHLYEEYGDDFVNHMNGQFAICLWDDNKKRLLLVRDRVGICPLYYTIEDGRLYFASEVKALKVALKNKLEINLDALDQIFTFWAPVSPNSIFKNVYEVSPGQMLVLENGDLKKRLYWDWEFPVDNYCSDSEELQAEQLHDLLIDATKIRLRSDVPVGAYLSGGLDSSVLVAMIKHYGEVPLRTFSINFEEQDFDEKSFQSALIKSLDADHSHLMIETDKIAENLVSTLYHAESPILRLAPVPMGMLSSLVRKNNFKVVLTGEGADEVLGGYDIFKESKVRHFWAKDPKSNFRPLLLKRLYPYLNLPDSGQAEYLKQFFGDSLEQPDAVCFSHLPRWNTTAKAKKFYSADLNAQLRSSPMDMMLSSLPEKLAGMHPFNRAQYIESKSLMGGYLLCSQGDRMLSKNSVEGRFPFLDHRVIEFGNKVPPKYKMKGLNEKNLLKKAMRQYLPKEIVRRHKQPYRAPDAQVLSGKSLSDEMRNLLSEPELKKNGFFDANKVKFLLKKSDSGRTLTIPESQALVGILSTQIITEQFIHS